MWAAIGKWRSGWDGEFVRISFAPATSQQRTGQGELCHNTPAVSAREFVVPLTSILARPRWCGEVEPARSLPVGRNPILLYR
jgi:hypothetical protein